MPKTTTPAPPPSLAEVKKYSIAADTATVLGWFSETRPAKSRAPLPSALAVDDFRFYLGISAATDLPNLYPSAPLPCGVSEETARIARALERAMLRDIEQLKFFSTQTEYAGCPEDFSQSIAKLKEVGSAVAALESGRRPKYTWHRLARRISDDLDDMALARFNMPKDRGADGWRCALVKRVLEYFGIPCGELEAVSDALRGKRGGQKKPIKKPLTARPDSIAKGHHQPATERQNDDR